MEDVPGFVQHQSSTITFMANTIATFKQLHHQSAPLLIGNVWNAQSARVFEKLGYKAIGTSSAAVAESLGYADGQAMSFEEYTFVITRIVKSSALPLSVDLESGYGNDASEIVKNIRVLQSLGVAGVNIEDSAIKKVNAKLQMRNGLPNN